MLEGSILKELANSYSPAPGDSASLSFGVYYKNTLVALCHALEDCILATDSSPLVITAFQQGKWYLEEADRYGEIANAARQIVIMAAPDAGFHAHPTGKRDNVRLIDLAEDDPVAQEWHLMIISPQYTAMVLCQELTPEAYGVHGAPTNDLERKFYGMWTFAPSTVRQTVNHAIEHIGKYDQDLKHTLEAHLSDILAANPDLTEVASGEAVGAAVSKVFEYLEDSRISVVKETASDNTDALRQNLASNELQAFLRMAQLVDMMDPANPEAAKDVVSLLEMMGQLIDLPAWRLQRLRLAGWLHRIAPFHPETFSAEAPSCPLVPGAQVLRKMPRLRAIATIVTHQTEHWDGSGQPAQLGGDRIPLESRMLGLVSHFQAQVIAHKNGGSENPLLSALEACEAELGSQWDPKLVEILSLMVKGLQQGLSLPSIPVKVSMASGLLNPDADAWNQPVSMQSSLV